MTTVYFHPHAADEMNCAALWYENQQKGLGKRFLASIQDCIQRIGVNPAICPEVCPHFRRGLVQRFPFAVVYKVVEDDIQIYAVMHLHREPEYWKDRSLAYHQERG